MSSTTTLTSSEMPTQDEINELSDFKDQIRQAQHMIDNVNKFKVGDILICKYIDSSGSARTYKANGGHAQKYKVVWINPADGVPAIRAMDGRGNFNGWLTSIFEDEDDVFELDPDYADHIVLQQDGVYDPGAKLKEFNKLVKDIRAKNKAANFANHDLFGTLDFNKEMFNKIGEGNSFWMRLGACKPSQFKLLKGPYKSAGAWKVKLLNFKSQEEEVYAVDYFTAKKTAMSPNGYCNHYARVGGLYVDKPESVPRESDSAGL